MHNNSTAPIIVSSTSPFNNLLTLREFMQVAKISESTLHRYLRKGLPSVGSGKLRRVLQNEAFKWIVKNNYTKNSFIKDSSIAKNQKKVVSVQNPAILSAAE